MSTDSNKAAIRRWVEEGWNKGNLAVVDEIYASDVVHHDPHSPIPLTSSEALKEYVSIFRTAFSDLRMTIEDLVAEGDKVLWHANFHGTHSGPLGPIPATGKSATAAGMILFRFANEKVAEVWVNVDILGLMQQIGAIPPMG